MDYNKCKEVVKALDNYYKDEKNIAEIACPSNVEYRSHEYYLYMFYSCLLDYGIRSKIYHKNLTNTYLKYPQIFNPNYVCRMSEQELKDIIVKNIRPRYPNIAVKKWLVLSNELKKFDSLDNYLKEIKSFDELNRFVRSIKGYGQKTGGLLVRIIYDSDICNFEENIKCIPIDRHDIEISYLNSIIDSKSISKNDIIKLSDLYVEVCNELKIDPSNIDRYLWETGNTYCNNKQCGECPLNCTCSKLKK